MGSLLMGPAIAGMHYTGMAAMRMTPGIDYDWLLVALSVVIAVVASGVAMWIAFHLRTKSSGVSLLRGSASLLMGIAIVGMHYTGMAAARFPLDNVCMSTRDGVNTGWLALVVIVVTLAVLAIALIDVHGSRRLQGDQRCLRASRGQSAARRRSAQRLRSIVQPEDTAARVGGNEFVLLVALDSRQAVAEFAQALTKAMGEPFRVMDRVIKVSASISIACFPEHGTTQSELLTNADTATYRAKSSGRNGYCFFEPSMHADTYRQVQLAQELHTALARGELQLHYQPKFSAFGGEVVGAEALVRWNHPVQGLLPPSKFVPIAEKTGAIVQIGERVLSEACRQMRAWLDAGHDGWSVSVNLSPAQFAHAGLLQAVCDALSSHRLDARRLILEITESTAMRDVEASLSVCVSCAIWACRSPSTTSAPAIRACFIQSAFPRTN